MQCPSDSDRWDPSRQRHCGRAPEDVRRGPSRRTRNRAVWWRSKGLPSAYETSERSCCPVVTQPAMTNTAPHADVAVPRGQPDRGHPREHCLVAGLPGGAAVFAMSMEDVQVSGDDDLVPTLRRNQCGQVGDQAMHRSISIDPAAVSPRDRRSPRAVNRRDRVPLAGFVSQLTRHQRPLATTRQGRSVPRRPGVWSGLPAGSRGRRAGHWRRRNDGCRRPWSSAGRPSGLSRARHRLAAELPLEEGRRPVRHRWRLHPSGPQCEPCSTTAGACL